MNIPFNKEQFYTSTNTQLGNVGDGSTISSAPTKFVTGRYNNNIESRPLTGLFTDNTNLSNNTNNPVDGVSWVNNKNLSAIGSNNGSFYKPNVWTPYNLNDSMINGTNQNNQTFPYDANSQQIGGLIQNWDSFIFSNINNSSNILEQVVSQEITPQDRPEVNNMMQSEEDTYKQREQIAINQLVDEMY
jgi:hypothetical protein